MSGSVLVDGNDWHIGIGNTSCDSVRVAKSMRPVSGSRWRMRIFLGNASTRDDVLLVLLCTSVLELLKPLSLDVDMCRGEVATSLVVTFVLLHSMAKHQVPSAQRQGVHAAVHPSG